MSNMILAHPNRGDGATLSGGSWSAGLPLVNLQTREIRKVARSTNTLLDSTRFDVDFGVSRAVKTAAIVGHNLSVDALYRITGADNPSFTSPGYSSGWQRVWPTTFASSTLEWSDDNFWSGRIPQEFIDGYPAVLLHLIESTAYRYWRLEIDDTTNADGYIDLGRLFLAEQRSPTFNYSKGAELGFIPKSGIEESEGGNEKFDIKRDPRFFSFELKVITDVEAYEWVFELQRRASTHGEILVIPDPDDVNNRHRRSFLARQMQLNPIVHWAYGYHSNAMYLKELI